MSYLSAPVSAPVWLALPPEVHSASLASGPGPGPLLATAEAWSSLGSAYTSAAAELTDLLAAVQGGAWQGGSAERYTTAHGPYLNWLSQSAANSTITAGLHQAAAGAYSSALAGMPTLAELGANHAVHAALVATNFFGVNTIPIALNEADYVRMWIQAAETMTGYQAVTESALAAVPPATPAPPIQTSHQQVSSAANAGSSWQDQLAALLSDYTHDFAWPLGHALYPNGWPIDATAFTGSLSSALTSLPGMSPALASALAWATFHTVMLFWPLVQLAPQLMVALLPALTATAGPAGMAGTAGLAGLAGLAGVTPDSGFALPPSGEVPAATAAGTGSAPVAADGVPACDCVTNAPAAPGPAVLNPAAPGAGPAGYDPGCACGPTASMADGLYLVNASRLSAQQRTGSSRRSQDQHPISDSAAAGAAAAETRAQQRTARRRQRAAATDRTHGHEFADLEPDSAGTGAQESELGTGPLGFAGAVRKPGVRKVSGLTTLADDTFGRGPTVPMLPGSWDTSGLAGLSPGRHGYPPTAGKGIR